jgi:hypothetical protein
MGFAARRASRDLLDQGKIKVEDAKKEDFFGKPRPSAAAGPSKILITDRTGQCSWPCNAA